MPNNKIIKPHRGKASVMSDSTKKNMVLENGELFIEIPDNVTNDNQYKIKIGDGVTTYENLKYAINGPGLMRGVSNITRSGSTFTATRLDGSTFTFTQDTSDIDSTKVLATGLSRVNSTNLLVLDYQSRIIEMNGVTISFKASPYPHITLNGTATANIALEIGSCRIPPGYFWLYGCRSGSSSKYNIRVNEAATSINGSFTYAQDSGSGDWGRYAPSTSAVADPYFVTAFPKLNINSGAVCDSSIDIITPTLIPTGDTSLNSNTASYLGFTVKHPALPAANNAYMTQLRVNGALDNIEELQNNLSGLYNTYGYTPSNIENFVSHTAMGPLICFLKFKDVNNVFGLGSNQWIRGFIQYQNTYDSAGDVYGQGWIYIQGPHPYSWCITGTSSTGFSIQWSQEGNYVERVLNGDANGTPNHNTFRIRELNGSAADQHLPTSAWYHIYDAMGPDGAYMTQLALGMTTDGVFYRRRSNSSFEVWRKLWYSSASILVRERYNVNVTVSSNTALNVTYTKSGYTPIMWNESHGYAGTVTGGLESVTPGNGTITLLGYYSRSSAISVPFRIDVLWISNQYM